MLKALRLFWLFYRRLPCSSFQLVEPSLRNLYSEAARLISKSISNKVSWRYYPPMFFVCFILTGRAEFSGSGLDERQPMSSSRSAYLSLYTIWWHFAKILTHDAANLKVRVWSLFTSRFVLVNNETISWIACNGSDSAGDQRVGGAREWEEWGAKYATSWKHTPLMMDGLFLLDTPYAYERVATAVYTYIYMQMAHGRENRD